MPLTGFSRLPKKRGRPKPIGDHALFQARGDLCFCLEEHWAQVGWSLRRAKTIAGIRKTLEQVTSVATDRLEVFRNKPTQRTTPKMLRMTRKALDEASAQVGTAYRRQKACKDAAEWARAALDLAATTPDVNEVRRLCQERERRLEAATAALQEREKERGKLEEDLMRQEAYFAQSELLDFILSGRHSLTPQKLASAMAGLPWIGWRQSYNRCSRANSTPSAGLTFEMFSVVDRVFKQPAKNSQNAIERMKEYLLDRKNRRQISCEELRQTWHYLRCAIESAFAARHDPQPISYVIFSEYQRRTQTRSPLDTLQEEDDRL